MTPTGTHFNYYQICRRKLWLFANGINMEHTSDTVYDGKLIHQGSYPQRTERYEEIAIEGIKVDYFDYRPRHLSCAQPQGDSGEIFRQKAKSLSAE